MRGPAHTQYGRAPRRRDGFGINSRPRVFAPFACGFFQIFFMTIITIPKQKYNSMPYIAWRECIMGTEPIEIQSKIYEIRGQRVMLDSSLAALYGVPTHRLNEAVKRNKKRFPMEFMFQLTDEEWKKLRSQFAILNQDTRKYKPYVFTEHGILMLSSVLNSEKAIDVNIQIMKIFVRMRQYALSQSDTNEHIVELRKLLMLHIENNDYRFSEYDDKIRQIIQALNNLIEQPKKTKTIGFNTGE